MLANIEKKVRASTAASTVLGLVLAVLTWAQDHPESLPALPRWAQGLILLVVPPLVTAVSGYLAAHTPRDPAAEAKAKALENIRRNEVGG